MTLVCREAFNKTRRMVVLEPKKIVEKVMFPFRGAPTKNVETRRRRNLVFICRALELSG